MKDSVVGIAINRVGQVVQDFIDDGALHVVAERDADGTFTVSAQNQADPAAN
jgi:hypothetical protein